MAEPLPVSEAIAHIERGGLVRYTHLVEGQAYMLYPSSGIVTEDTLLLPLSASPDGKPREERIWPKGGTLCVPPSLRTLTRSPHAQRSPFPLPLPLPSPEHQEKPHPETRP